MIDLFQSPPFAHVRQRNKISVKFFYLADCQTDRALLGQLCLADKRVKDFEFLPAKLPPLFLVLGLLGQARLDYPMAVGRVVFSHGCEPPFVGGFFKRHKRKKTDLGVATPTRFP